LDAALMFCEGRSFIVTEEGYIGLAPDVTEAGDVVCVFLGCDSPLILRPMENGRYNVVGECYVCGLTDNTALLGPFPENFQFVWRMNEETGYYAAYLNCETGETLVEDSRLGPLPTGWRRLSHDADWLESCFVKDGDKEGTWQDPRCTPEALEARGVDLTVFELV